MRWASALSQEMGFVPAFAEVSTSLREQLGEAEKRLSSYSAESYAALWSYTDHQIGRLIEGIEAMDERTVTVRWKEPFIDADTLFSPEFLMPRPRHRLADRA